MTTVSIIVPSYNHGRFLRQRLDSILNQTYRHFEVILLDDASTDETPVVLKEYAGHPRLQLIVRPTNSGSVFRQWNAGIALARGEYAWIAESDDWAEPTFLEELTAVLDRHPRVGLVKCRSTVVDQDGRPTGEPAEYPVTRDWSDDFIISGLEDCRLQLRHGNSITNASAVLFRRQVYLDAGWADESYRMCADWLQWAKMMFRADFAYVARPLNYYRQHQNTVRQRCLGNVIHDLEDLRVCAYLLSHLPPSHAAAQQVCDQIVPRWIRHSLSRSRIENSLAYDLQMVRLLCRLQCRWGRQTVKSIMRRIIERCRGKN